MQRQMVSEMESHSQQPWSRRKFMRAVEEEIQNVLMRIEAIDNRLMETGVPEEVTRLQNYKRGVIDALFSFVMGCNPGVTYNEVKTAWETYVEEVDLSQMTQGISIE